MAQTARDVVSGLHQELRGNSAATKHSGGMQITDLYAFRTGGELSSAIEEVERAEHAAELELEEIQSRRAGGNGRDHAATQMVCCASLRTRLRLAASVYSGSPSVAAFLVLVGVLAALGGAGIDAIVAWLVGLRDQWSGGESSMLGWLVFTVFGATMAVIAASVGHLITDKAEGSGIPQLKSILAGTWLRRYLSLDTLLAKTLGLIAALASGLVVGKEGPFVHMAAIAAAKLWALPCFRAVRQTDASKRQVLAAAVAAGVTATLGAPIGGMLFSVETTATFYQVSNLWRALLCSLACIFVFEAIQALSTDDLFQPTEFDAPDMTWQIAAFALLGVLCGCMASVLVACTSSAQLLRRALQRRFSVWCSRYLLTIVVVFVTATAAFILPVLRLRDRDVINHLFQDRDGAGATRRLLMMTTSQCNTTITAQIADECQSPSRHLSEAQPLPEVWGSGGGLASSLFTFIVTRITLTPISISLPIPCGLFTPIFALGAAVGRLYGEGLRMVLPAAIAATVEPGAYAVVGAASLSAGTTHTLSVAVIVFELTQQIQHMLPILVAVVASYLTSSVFTLSIYDMLLSVTGLPFLPRLHSAKTYTLSASDVAGVPPYLTTGSTLLEAAALLMATGHHERQIRGTCQWVSQVVQTRMGVGERIDRSNKTAARARRDLAAVLELLGSRPGLKSVSLAAVANDADFWRGRCDEILVLKHPHEPRQSADDRPKETNDDNKEHEEEEEHSLTLVGMVTRTELMKVIERATGSDAESLVASAARSMRLGRARASDTPLPDSAVFEAIAAAGVGVGDDGSLGSAPPMSTDMSCKLLFRSSKRALVDASFGEQASTALQMDTGEQDDAIAEGSAAATTVSAAIKADTKDEEGASLLGAGSDPVAADDHHESASAGAAVVAIDTGAAVVAIDTVAAVVAIDTSPMSVSASTPLSKAQFLFASCLFTQLVVVNGHKVVGVIHRQDMADPTQAAAAQGIRHHRPYATSPVGV